MPDLLPCPPQQSAMPPAELIRFDNGLTLIYQALASAVVTLDVWLPAGATTDPAEGSGMAHFLEHLIFKGTESLEPGAFDALVENCGGITNAATGYDEAHFYITTTVEQWEQVLPVFAELLWHAAIPAEEFEQERRVVLEELRQAQDDPDWVGSQALMTQVYGESQHPYGRPILGSEAHLLRQSPEQLRQFHRQHYVSEQMTLVVAGGVSRDRALSLIQQHFGSIQLARAAYASPQPSVTPLQASKPPAIQLTPARQFPAEPPPAESLPTEQRWNRTSLPQQQTLTLPQLEQARLMMAWTGPGAEDPQTGTGLDLLAAILSDGRLSRLVQELREQRRWVSDVDSRYVSDRLGGLFTLTVWLEPCYLQKVEAAITAQLQRLQTHLVDAAELQRAQTLLERDFIFSLETPEDFAELYGHASILNQLDQVWDYPQWVQAWTPEGLQRLAQQYLSSTQACLTRLCPPDDE